MTSLSDGTITFDHVTLTVTFDLHLENFTLHITCLELDIGFSYGASVFFMARPFRWDSKFDRVTMTFDLHSKKLKLYT